MQGAFFLFFSFLCSPFIRLLLLCDWKAIFSPWTLKFWLQHWKVTLMKVIFTLCLYHYIPAGLSEWLQALVCLLNVIFHNFHLNDSINVTSKTHFSKYRRKTRLKHTRKQILKNTATVKFLTFKIRDIGASCKT